MSLTVLASDVKALLGVTSTDYDSRIGAIIALSLPAEISYLRPESVADPNLQAELTKGLTFVIAGEIEHSLPPAALARNGVKGQRAGSAASEYFDTYSTTKVGTGGLDSWGDLGRMILGRYQQDARGAVLFDDAVPDIVPDLVDINGNIVRQGNIPRGVWLDSDWRIGVEI